MLDEDILNEIFVNRHEMIDEKIQEEYHKRVKLITEKDEEERNNIKINIISELYYKQGFKDGINFIINNINKQ